MRGWRYCITALNSSIFCILQEERSKTTSHRTYRKSSVSELAGKMLPRRILGCAKFPAVASWQARKWFLQEKGLYSTAVIGTAWRSFLSTSEPKRGGDLIHSLRGSTQANDASASGIRRITNTAVGDWWSLAI